MKFFLKTVTGILAITAAAMLAIISVFGNPLEAKSKTEELVRGQTDAVTMPVYGAATDSAPGTPAEGTQENPEEEAAPGEAATEAVPPAGQEAASAGSAQAPKTSLQRPQNEITAANVTLPVPVQSASEPAAEYYPALYENLVTFELPLHRSYAAQEDTFTTALRMQLALQIDIATFNVFTENSNHLIYIEFSFKDHQNTQWMLADFADAPVWENGEHITWESLMDTLLYISKEVRRAAVDVGLTNSHVAVAFTNSMTGEPLLTTLNDRIFYNYYDAYEAPPDLTPSQIMAVATAMAYVNVPPVSRARLLEELLYARGNLYSVSDAVFAIEYLETHRYVNWEEQAIIAAMLHLYSAPFSRQALIRQLSSETGDRFTAWEAVYAMDYLEQNEMVDWNEQALVAARSYTAIEPYSHNELMEQLTNAEKEGYTWEQAEYALNALSARETP